jgi:hypothetical protein
MGIFFKVWPLNGPEWGISVSIGVGAVLVSIITRAISQALPRFCCGLPRPPVRRGPAQPPARLGSALVRALSRKASGAANGKAPQAPPANGGLELTKGAAAV